MLKEFESDEVAREIEQELYKMYGSVNKDYKTKYRSLNFNLKNPKNPGNKICLSIQLIN